jgi:FkbM family methyltransferase
MSVGNDPPRASQETGTAYLPSSSLFGSRDLDHLNRVLTHTSYSKEFKQFLALVARTGLPDGVRVALRELGVRTLETATFPGLKRRFVVEFDPVWRWTAKGVREPGVLKFVEERIKEGSTVLDVGAHLGEWSLLFSELVGQSGSVFAFEPDPVARASLVKNLRLNRISNVTVEADSISDRTGNVMLAAERFGSGLSSIVRQRTIDDGGGSRAGYDRIEVPSTTLDEYCQERGISPDWIKVDAEGAEPLIVRGMRRLIEERHPSAIIEFHSRSLTDAERTEAWSTVTQGASTVEFLQSGRTNHTYLEKLTRDYVPDCGFLVVHIQY